MELGSKEWIEKVNENYKFPCYIAFLMVKENEDTVKLCTSVVKGNDNVKYKHINKDTTTGVGTAILSVDEYYNANQYLSEYNRLKVIWGFALKGV
jgi:hypothetical protein